MDYVVRPTPRGWTIHASTGCCIGTVATKREATQIARLLAGWRGKVHEYSEPHRISAPGEFPHNNPRMPGALPPPARRK